MTWPESGAGANPGATNGPAFAITTEADTSAVADTGTFADGPAAPRSGGSAGSEARGNLEPDSPPADASTVGALWQPFWQPFRSQIAANGFASRLTALTGLDYRVMRLERGAYQVAFAYADDSERVAKLTQIETQTGLQLPEVAR